MLGSWAMVLPEIKKKHSLDDAMLSSFMMLFVIGAIAGGPFVGKFIERFGSKNSAFFGSLLCIVVMPSVGVSSNLWVLGSSCVCFGFSAQFLDISMNNLGVLCQKYGKQPTLGFFHSLYALGGLTGGFLAGFLLQIRFSVFGELCLTSLIAIAPSIASLFWAFTFAEENNINFPNECCRSTDAATKIQKQNSATNLVCTSIQEKSPSESILQLDEISKKTAREQIKSSKFPKTLCVLCIVGGIAYMVEGSVSDWSAVYLELSLGSNHLVGSFGFVFFQLSVAILRLCSDKLFLVVKPWKILVFCGIFSGLGIILVVIAPTFLLSQIVAVVGFAITGVGLSMITPVVISLAGNLNEERPAARSIALVSSISYIGMLLGPAIIGLLSKIFGCLRWALLFDVFCLSFVSAFALTLKRKSIITKNSQTQPANYSNDEEEGTVSILHLDFENKIVSVSKQTTPSQKMQRRQSECEAPVVNNQHSERLDVNAC